MSDNSIRDLAREFAQRVVAPQAAEIDRTGSLPDGLISQMGEVGLMGLLIPEEFGGTAQGLRQAAQATGALAEACGSTAWAYLAYSCAVRAFVAFGTEEQKHRYLPDLAEGKRFMTAVAGTEDTGGSNPMGFRTTAQPDGDGYVLNGTKIFISNVGFADIYLVLAKTGSQPGPGAFSMFIVEKGMAGVSFPRREDTFGVRGVTVGEIVLENCRVSKEQLLGKEGGGLQLMGPIGGMAVTGAAAAAVGMAHSAVGMTRNYLKERLCAGQPLAAIPGVQQNWARTLMAFESCVAMAEHGLVQAVAGGSPVVPWLAKVQVTETALQVIDRCLQLHGMNGYSREFPLERLYRDCRALSIHWANNDVLITNSAATSLG